VLQGVALRCVRGQRTLFSDLSFEVGGGELFWVSGANGSGKTSLLRILCTLMRPESGEVRWGSAPISALGEAYRAELVYIGHAPAVKDDLSALENLYFSLRQQGIDAPAPALIEALHEFGLAEREDLPARVLSQGQRRRVTLARLAFCASRKLWVLDEPLTALDVAAVELIRAMVGAHLARGGVVVLTSHQEMDFSGAALRRLRLGV